MIQLKDLMKLNKKKVQSADASNPLRRGNKIIIGGRGMEGAGGRGKGKENGVKKKTMYGTRQKRSPKSQEN